MIWRFEDLSTTSCVPGIPSPSRVGPVCSWGYSTNAAIKLVMCRSGFLTWCLQNQASRTLVSKRQVAVDTRGGADLIRIFYKVLQIRHGVAVRSAHSVSSVMKLVPLSVFHLFNFLKKKKNHIALSLALSIDFEMVLMLLKGRRCEETKERTAIQVLGSSCLCANSSSQWVFACLFFTSQFLFEVLLN